MVSRSQGLSEALAVHLGMGKGMWQTCSWSQVCSDCLDLGDEGGAPDTPRFLASPPGRTATQVQTGCQSGSAQVGVRRRTGESPVELGPQTVQCALGRSLGRKCGQQPPCPERGAARCGVQCGRRGSVTIRADLFLPLSENPLSRWASGEAGGVLCHAGGQLAESGDSREPASAAGAGVRGQQPRSRFLTPTGSRAVALTRV